MKALLLFLVAAAVASQVLGEGVEASGEGVTVTTVRRGGANLGLLNAKKFKCSKPDFRKFTFGWAHSGVLLPSDGAASDSPGGPTGNRCYDVCGLGYRLAAVFSPPKGPPKEPPKPSGPPPKPADTLPFLCRIKYTTTTFKDPDTNKAVDETLYGYYTGARDDCTAYSPLDGKVVRTTVGSYDCGCCGTINRDGQRWERGCERVTASVPKAAFCNRDLFPSPDQTSKEAEPGTEICSKTPPTGVDELWGTIDPQNRAGRCFVANPNSKNGDKVPPLGKPDDYNRFCYKINPYGGPPAPDCKHRNP